MNPPTPPPVACPLTAASDVSSEANAERVGAGEKPKRNEVLVPNTCVLDASEISGRLEKRKKKIQRRYFEHLASLTLIFVSV